MARRLVRAVFFLFLWACSGAPDGKGSAPLRAGAFAIDITPEAFPVIVNGSRLERVANQAKDRLHARWLVLDDGSTTLALCVVDTCLIPREFADRVKEACRNATRIPASNILISATHTHSAPSLMGALGSDPDPAYPDFLFAKLVEGLQRAMGNLAPARVGWNSALDPEHTHCRQWIYRSDKIQADPFGDRSVRANMGPGYQNPDAIGPTGPVDPELSVLAVQSPEGRPLAVLANYSMHYKGAELLSADYYGKFCARIESALNSPGGPPFMAMLSQGTSGDLMWMDYGRPKNDPGLEAYANAVADVALKAYGSIEYRDRAPLALREKSLRLRRRVPDAERLAWARKVVVGMGGRKPASTPEAWAREQIFLHEEPERDVKLQAIRIGDLGIAAIPCEVFALTGLKIKARSPLVPTFTIGLANGEEGYIPPPELHRLGGYTTWPARTAGLEVQAEPRILESVLQLLEEVAGKPQRTPPVKIGAYAQAVLAAKPAAYWRLDDFNGPSAQDASGQKRPARFEEGIAFHLDGPPFRDEAESNRAVHLAGGCVIAEIPPSQDSTTVEFWFWNGLPANARPVTAFLFCNERSREYLGIGGTERPESLGKLFYSSDNASGRTQVGRLLKPRTWYHIALVRTERSARVYLNGVADMNVDSAARLLPGGGPATFGGRGDGFSSLEGKLDEVAIYRRALGPQEIAAHYAAAGLAPE